MPIAVQAALGVIALTGLLVAAFLIPTLQQIRRTAQELQSLLKTLELELQPALIDLKEAIRHLNTVSGEVSRSLEKVGGTVEAIQKVGKTIRVVNSLLSPRLIVAVSFLKGLGAGIGSLVKELGKKKEEQP